MLRVFRDITETIGSTPPMCLNRTAEKRGAVSNVLLKFEFFNPLSSECCLSMWLFNDSGTESDDIDELLVVT